MTLQELVNRAASLYSDRKAVWFDECNDKPPTFYTYATVVKLAVELTAFLQKHCEQQGNLEIGLYCYPGIDLPSWILGILQVPAAYSPIDPDAPPMLSAYFMKKSNLQHILVENDKINKFQMSHAGFFCHNSSTIEHTGLTLFQMYVSNTDLNSQVDNMKSKHEPFKAATGNLQPGYTICPDQTKTKTSEGGYMDVGQKDSLAYILHTSGTTGIPKIVRVPHKCIVPNIQHLKSIFQITQDDMLFLASPLTFDPSVVELFLALSSGASILVVPNTVKMMPVELSAALFRHHHVTVLQATPTLLRRFGSHIIRSAVLSANSSLRVLALGGEAFPVLNLLKSWKHKKNKTSIFNLYGITEVSSWATCYKIPEEVFSADLRTDLPIPLGSPLLGTKVEVRDTNGSAVLEGEGQIFIGGEERICFLDDEITVPLGTMRETGDFVRVQNSKLFFLGRKDNQIKRHGKRFNIECLQQSALGVLDDSTRISKDAVFVYSGGDSLKALRFYDEIEMLVGKAVPGLLEVILSHSIEEVYRHILKILFPDENQLMNYDSVMKRKLSGNSGENFHGKCIKLKSERGLEVASGLIPFIAVSRGNNFFSMDFNKSFMQPHNTVQVGVEVLQQPSFLHLVTPSIMKSHVQGYETEKILTVMNKASKPNCCSVQQIHAESSDVTMAELALGIRWKSNTRKCVDASPLIVIPSKEVSASVYVGSHSHAMQAIDLNLGEIKWEKNLGDRIESSACISKCGNFIVVGCYDGLVYVLQSSDGEIHWTFVTEDAVKSSAVVDSSSGLVYIGSHDEHVYALDIYKKACIWKLHCEGGAVFSSPCLSSFPHHLYVATLRGLLLAVNPVTGNKIWKSFLGKPLFSSPHCNEKYICVGCVDGNLYCYNHSGEKVWQFSTNGPVFSSPCISSLTKQEIFFGSHDRFIYCCNMEGNLLWKFEVTSSVYGTPFVFQSDNLKNKIFLAAVSTDGKVWILNAKSGTAEGVDKLPGEVFSSPVVWGTKLVVGCRNDYVYCLDLYITGKKKS
ncbi:beta-alanine-activating enzyme isoform X2 [Athene noctua]|uniref:beta-alanine-activating enzyme isoform X2 n=1 Tax=Athene noctua TaxID=126797 RepID=UPI003EB8D3C4